MIFSCFTPQVMIFFSYFVIDWDRNLFNLPFLHHPVSWYGILFAFSFFIGYFLTKKITYHDLLHRFSNPELVSQKSLEFTERLTLFVVLGSIIGARFGHIFFYEWKFYQKHPIEIFKLWEGGLASHGGVIGIFIAIFLFIWTSKKKFPYLTFPMVLDTLVIPGAFAGGCIRIGNLINQEILGKPTELPWGIIFGHPAQKVSPIPLHPVQIYESLAYFFTFIFLFWLWKKRGSKVGEGILSAFFFLLVFGFRFLIEFFKMPQSDFYDGKHFLNMGQLLSIPFIIAGAGFILYYFAFRKKN